MYVKHCKSCEKYALRNKKHEHHSRDIPTLPYECVSADIIAFVGKNVLIITDAYSKWVDIVPLQGKTVESVVDACTKVAVHGDSQILVSDNISFNSREFRDIAKDRFELPFSSPRYAQSNGLAEKGVHIAKLLLRLPLSMDKLKPRVQEDVHEWLKHREKKTRQWCNRTPDRKYIAFKSGQNVVERTSHGKF
ncbi:hypothetical protein PR048_023131 [Dryococelus australis]|uniref:Integrase catalytic domain-containing protein n=1 Tax=Dryococelus australis TaxID=614101 RepID=A0ABQ9GT68_9NEOP|nr:hypothetical protein PR048_023131 [Dryococelus australis]